jgi:hypothetical protein
MQRLFKESYKRRMGMKKNPKLLNCIQENRALECSLSFNEFQSIIHLISSLSSPNPLKRPKRNTRPLQNQREREETLIKRGRETGAESETGRSSEKTRLEAELLVEPEDPTDPDPIFVEQRRDFQ